MQIAREPLILNHVAEVTSEDAACVVPVSLWHQGQRRESHELSNPNIAATV